MKIFAFLLIIAVLCSVGLVSYNANLFEVTGGVASFINNVGYSVKVLLNKLGFIRGNYFIVYTYVDNGQRYGFVSGFEGRLYSSNVGLLLPTGFENSILHVDYSGPYPYSVPFEYFKINIFYYLDGYTDSAGNNKVFTNGGGVFAPYKYSYVFRDDFSTACSDLDDYLVNGTELKQQIFN